ncbi:MAG: DTW domain-containing protein [Methylotenera sp.]|nr:DTW domain-containing protein [Oligoflexia bacterium]
MSSRRFKSRCATCGMTDVLCLCAVIPVLKTETRLIVLMHWRETKTTTNTARLATLALRNSELRIRGLEGESMSTDGLVDPDRQSLYLYPSDDARELTREYARSFGKPITLIVPDGSWKQASKVKSRISELDCVPCVKLPSGKPSEYQLRQSPHAESVSTFEAIARAMGILEGQEVERPLEFLFKTMVDRILWARGKLSPDACTGGLPEVARDRGTLRDPGQLARLLHSQAAK